MSQQQDNFRRGATELLVLHLLQSEDLYVYQIVKMLKKKSNGIYCVISSSLYPILYKLVDAGYITEREETVKQRRKRIYYHLEDKGREYYRRILSEYRDITNGILKILDIELNLKRKV